MAFSSVSVIGNALRLRKLDLTQSPEAVAIGSAAAQDLPMASTESREQAPESLTAQEPQPVPSKPQR